MGGGGERRPRVDTVRGVEAKEASCARAEAACCAAARGPASDGGEVAQQRPL